MILSCTVEVTQDLVTVKVMKVRNPKTLNEVVLAVSRSGNRARWNRFMSEEQR